MTTSSSSTVRTITRALGLTRVIYGLALLLAPGLVGGHWLGAGATAPASHPPARSLGIRDAVIGLATLSTAGDPPTCARVVAWGAAGDTVDAVGTVLAHRRDSRVARSYAALAALAAIISMCLSAALRDRRA